MSVLRSLRSALQAQPGFPGLLLSTVALGVAYSFVSPYLSLWATQKIGLQAWQFGAFMTFAAVCAMLVSTTLARWSDYHLSRRTTLTLGALGGLLGYSAYAFLTHPLALACIAGSFVALSTVCFPQLFAHVRERFDDAGAEASLASFRMSLVRVCFSVAWTAGPAAGAFVMQTTGFRGLFLCAAGLYALFLLGIWRFVPAQPPRARQTPKAPVWRVLARADILAAFLAFMAVFAAHAINMINLPLLTTRVLGGSTRDLGFIFGVGPLVEIPLMLWFGHLAGLGHQRKLIILGAAVTVVYFVLLGLVSHPWQLLLVQILSGISFAILTNVAILYFQDLLPGQPGLGTALFSNAGNAGNLAGFLSFGLLVAPLGHQGLYVLCASLTLVTLLIVSFLHARPAAPTR